MKRFFSCLLAALLLVSLTACGGSLEPAPDPEDAYLLDGTPVDESGNDGYIPEGEDPLEGLTGAEAGSDPEEIWVLEGETYTAKEDVAQYLHIYGCLPDNFITKEEAQALGWSGGSLEPYAPGKCIGGSYFGNYEGLLPEAEGRSYAECDIDTLGASSRGAQRIVYSNDGLIYYTGDHYESFELLYGEE